MQPTPPSDTPRNYMSLQSNYSYNNEYPPPSSNVLPGISTQSAGLMSGSQPGTPKPEIMTSPPLEKLSMTSTTPDLVRKRPPLPSRPATFTTTTFHSNPYPNNVSLRRRRTESSMFSFEAGPTFSQTKQLLDLCNTDQSNGYQVHLHAKIDRGFFRADQDWTCYRRNYFQVSSTFDIHGMNYLLQGPEVPCLVRTAKQELFQIDFFTIGVTARVSGSDKKIELVQHTPKRDKGPQMIPEPRVVSAGGNLHLASVGSNHNIVTFERMQFKTATANNGKRRAAQQYYEIVVDLFANSSTGKSFKVATSVSAPLVVRGRSPGHYADSHTRYRNMDDGQSSSVPFAGQGVGNTPTTSTSTPTTSTTTNTMTSPNQQRYALHNNSGEFYAPYQPTAATSSTSHYPYQIGGFAPILSTPNEKEHRESNGYMMHPYHPLSSNNDYNSNSSYGHPSDQKPYWMNRENNTTSEQPHRYNNNTSSSSPYEFNSYHMRSMSSDTGNDSSESINDNRHYLQQQHH